MPEALLECVSWALLRRYYGSVHPNSLWRAKRDWGTKNTSNTIGIRWVSLHALEVDGGPACGEKEQATEER